MSLSKLWLLVATSALALTGCGSQGTQGFTPTQTPAQHEGLKSANPPANPSSDYDPVPIAERLPAPVVLPLVLRPTDTGATINVTAPGRCQGLRLEYRQHAPRTVDDWQSAGPAQALAKDTIEYKLRGLRSGQRYEYRITATDGYQVDGSFVARRPVGATFSFALISDPHIYVRDFSPEELAAMALDPRDVARSGGLAHALRIRRTERAHGHAILPRVAELIVKDAPDLLFNLGDIIDLHGFGFNAPVPSRRWVRKGLLDYRWLLGALGRNAAHFAVLGNWDGEKGCFTPQQRRRARSQRLIYLPNPTPTTYPEGGSAHQDYYAFRWGDALFVVLNVISYTVTEHVLQKPARSDDFTLGAKQLAWFERTLTNATSPWKFVLIHHVVGGRAGNERNSSYGRGGGHAAKVGEQARVHELMKKHGVAALFYGHDHVFYDMTVDSIHYTTAGSAGAPWKFTTAETGYQVYWPDSGYARVRVSPSQVNVEFISVEGRRLHGYTITPPPVG